MSKDFVSRALTSVACIAILIFFERLHLLAVGVLVIVLGVTLLGRGLFKSKLHPNPLGADRDFSLKPMMRPLIKGLAMLLAAVSWGSVGALALHFGLVPNTKWLVIGVLALPAIALAVMGAAQLLSALRRFQYGSSK
jgi:hypothetical protein